MKKIKNVKLFITDCDGVMTNGDMYYLDNGVTAKIFNCKDGMAFTILKNKNIKTAIISGDNSKSLEFRNEKLKSDYLIMNSKDKLQDIKKICYENNIELSDVLYVGDDLNDVEAMKVVGISFCPHNAPKYIKEVANYVTRSNGGTGVIREIVDDFIV